ncbi:unnamed protein product [Cylindrotheca closterium]|uniref:Exonuclease 1 n=1 Tax=Cylindrotheca closterium TaxID=2856 RepID=A0AAD2CJS6_9STRA|nr:unnamed protein product [Cylindrotheca closterium]
MGIAGFLAKVLETAGRPVDVRDYAQGKVRSHKRSRRRKFRIGVDLTSSIYKAAFGFGDMLGDERHLTNFGRAELLEEQQQNMVAKNDKKVDEYIARCAEFVMKRLEMLRKDSDCDILVVFDGETPPIKAKEAARRRDIRREHTRQRDAPLDPDQSDFRAAEEVRVKANRRAGAGKHFGSIVCGLIESLKEANIAYLFAPYEADGQLTYLSKLGFIDLIVSEDSDLIAHGAKAIIYNYISGNGFPDEGKLLQFEDLGEVPGKFDLSDFSPVMMAILFVSVGCDYIGKLKGIGLGTASKIVREAFLGGSVSPLATIVAQLCERSWERDLSEDKMRDYERRFVAAVFTYQHPIVFDPVQGKALIQGESEMVTQTELTKHEGYARLCRDQDQRSQVIGIVKEPEAARIAAVTPYVRKAAGPTKRNGEEKTANSPPGEGPTNLKVHNYKRHDQAASSTGKPSRSIGHSQMLLDSEIFCSHSQEIGLLTAQSQSPPPTSGSERVEAGDSQTFVESSRYETQLNSEQSQQEPEFDSTSKKDSNSLDEIGSVEQRNQTLQLGSPNLLYSSSPEKSQTQRSEQSSVVATLSPNLLN